MANLMDKLQPFKVMTYKKTGLIQGAFRVHNKKIFNHEADYFVNRNRTGVSHAWMEELIKQLHPDIPASLSQEIDVFIPSLQPVIGYYERFRR